MDVRNAKIAVASDDGTTVSSHFGRAAFYEVLEFRNGVPASRERRAKFAPHSGTNRGETEGAAHAPHDHKHALMVDPIRDCQIVVARGMGDGAYIHLTEAGLTTILTSLHTVEELVDAVQGGTLEHQPQRLHHHR